MDKDYAEESSSQNNFITPRYHPRARRRRSRIIANNFLPDSSAQSPEDSGYEASPSSVTYSRSFTFEYEMPTDFNGPRAPPPVEELDSPTSSLTPPIPIQQPARERNPFSGSPLYRSGFLASPVALISSGSWTSRPRGASAPPAVQRDQVTVATQTDQSGAVPEIHVHSPRSVRHRRASSAMAAPLPDVVPPSRGLTRPRSLSTCSFPGFDVQEIQPLSVGTRLRSLSDQFEESSSSNVALLQNSI